MKRKKILVVSKSFYPQNSPRSFRTTELVKEFARQGHSVTILTHKLDEHSKFEKEYNIKFKDLGPKHWKSIDSKGSGTLLRKIIRHSLTHFAEYPDLEYVNLVYSALKRESGYDLLVSIAIPYPVHWGVARAQSNRHNVAKVWIADCGDPYMGQENGLFAKPFYFKYVEKWFCRRTDFLTVPTEASKQAYYPEFREKIKVIPQGFKFEDICLGKNLIINQVPTFAYAGSFYPGKRDPKELLNYLSSLKQDFRFVIYTKQENLVLPYVKQGDSRIELKNYIPREELLQEIQRMDFVINFENFGSTQTPSKLIDYAILDKPILSIKTGELDKNKVSQFLDGDFSRAVIIENKDQYRIENVTRKFLNLLNISL